MKIAAIDIGSNACRMLICEVLESEKRGPQFIKLNLVRVPLRLGFDVFENGMISESKIEDFISTFKSYRHLMNVYDIQHYDACATSAMRDAKNSSEIIKRIKEATGIDIRIISGKEEADTIFQNHFEKYLDSNKPYLYIDVGGGSTELTLFNKNEVLFEESFNVGAIRLLKKKVEDAEWNRLKEFVKTKTKGINSIIGIGSGGNINKVFSMSKRKDGKPLPVSVLNEYYEEFKSLSVPERMAKYNLREDRADVIFPAIMIYTSVMRWANMSEIYVPQLGLVDGLLQNLYNRIKNTPA